MKKLEKPKKYHNYTQEDVSPMNCICCGESIDDSGPTLNSPPENSCWNSGVVDKISSGYGSIHDGSVFLICVCDKCLTQKRDNGTIIFLYDYMNELYSQDQRDEYNKILHRKMKLKRIIK